MASRHSAETVGGAMNERTAFLPDEEEDLVAYLAGLYQGVFTEDAVRSHLVDHVGFGFADYAVAVTAPFLSKGAQVLDLGAGFGSYVLAARDAGLDAVGIELAAFEVAFARARLARLRRHDDPTHVFREGDARELGRSIGPFDAVTLWNVLEHIEDAENLLKDVDRLLAPGGQVFLVCPNYQATRDEAHYHVPWNADLSADPEKAITYLASLGRDPRYYQTSIFCRSHSEVVGILERLGYDLFELSGRCPMSLGRRTLLPVLRDITGFFRARSPTRHSVEIAAVKPQRGRPKWGQS